MYKKLLQIRNNKITSVFIPHALFSRFNLDIKSELDFYIQTPWVHISLVWLINIRALFIFINVQARFELIIEYYSFLKLCFDSQFEINWHKKNVFPHTTFLDIYWNTKWYELYLLPLVSLLCSVYRVLKEWFYNDCVSVYIHFLFLIKRFFAQIYLFRKLACGKTFHW